MANEVTPKVDDAAAAAKAAEAKAVSTDAALRPEKPAEPAKETPKPAPEPAKPPEGDKKVSEEGKAPEKPVVPDKYDLKLPDGSLLDPARVETVAAYAKQNGLSNAQAQSVLERESEAVSTYQGKQAELLKQKSTEWLGDMKADAEFGGEAFNQNVELAKRVVTRFGDDTFKKALDETGLGNHPGLVKTFVRIGKLMSEDQLVIPGDTSKKADKSMEDIFYGETSGKEKQT